MLRFLPLLLACGQPAPLLVEADGAIVASTLSAIDPAPLLDLVDDPRLYVTPEVACPRVETPHPSVERWLGDCTQDSGAHISGQLEIVTTPDATWVAGDRFSVHRGGELEFHLDGAVELTEQSGLQLIDGAASWCGAPGPDCSAGPVTVDLSFTLFTEPDGPTDATVSGAVGTDAGLVAIEGSWRADSDVCPTEPISGSFSLRADQGHAIEMDGQVACDGCATWVVQGMEVAPFCGFGS